MQSLTYCTGTFFSNVNKSANANLKVYNYPVSPESCVSHQSAAVHYAAGGCAAGCSTCCAEKCRRQEWCGGGAASDTSQQHQQEDEDQRSHKGEYSGCWQDPRGAATKVLPWVTFVFLFNLKRNYESGHRLQTESPIYQTTLAVELT